MPSEVIKEDHETAITAQELLSEIFILAKEEVVGFVSMVSKSVRIELLNGQKFIVTVTEEK